MLGVPPAFVLSQDQTLYKFVSLQGFFRFPVIISSLRITRNYCFSHSVIVFFADFTLSFFFCFTRKGILGFQFIFVSIVQFSRCKFLFVVRFEVFFVLHRCNYFIVPHFRKFVKPFFKVFLKVFSEASLHFFSLKRRPQCSVLYRFSLLASLSLLFRSLRFASFFAQLFFF